MYIENSCVVWEVKRCSPELRAVQGCGFFPPGPEERLSFPLGVIHSSIGASAWAVLPRPHCPPLKSALWVRSGSSCSCRHLEGLCLQCSEVRVPWDSRALPASPVPARLYPTSSHPNAQTKLLTARRWSLLWPCPSGGAHCSVSIAAAAHPAGLGAGRAPRDGMLLLPPSSNKAAAEWAPRRLLFSSL